MIHFCDVTPPSIAANLALDEALLLHAELGGPEVLRIWEWPRLAVVLGAGGKHDDEIDGPACERDYVPVLRRSSGGGTVVLGTGCLCFSLVLGFDSQPALADLHASYRVILDTLCRAFAPFAPEIAPAGISDLAVAGRKCSGNAQQRKRTHLLHHGTLLYDFDLPLCARYLQHPPREPEYRAGRPHTDFVTNLAASRSQIVTALQSAWHATTPLPSLPEDLVERLVNEKYSQETWNRRR